MTTPFAEDTGLTSGAPSNVCEVMAAMRELDDKEDDAVKEFVCRGSGCDFGLKKTPCSMLFPIEHYRSFRASFSEMSHDKLDLFVMGQIMAHCYQSSTLHGHHSSTPEGRQHSQFYHLGQYFFTTLASNGSKISRTATWPGTKTVHAHIYIHV